LTCDGFQPVSFN
jgi:hypothetical protein